MCVISTRSSLNLQRANRVLAAAAAILLTTAILKLIALLRPPAGRITADAVIHFLTKREVALLAGISELLLAYVLMAWTCVYSRVYLLWMFCLCAIVYHVGAAMLPAAAGCSCLGLAETWMGSSRSELLSLLLLLVLVGLGALALRNGAGLAVDSTMAARGKLFFLGFAIILVPIKEGQAASVAVTGVFSYVPEEGQSVEKPFTAQLDREALLLKHQTPNAGPYVPSGPCDIITRIDLETITSHSKCQGLTREVVRLDDARFAYELGNCGATLSTAVFLTLKLQALFPDGELRGERRLAPTQATIGLPFSLVTIGRWRYEGDNADRQLRCDVIVDAKLLRSWPSSPLLLEELLIDKDRMRHERFMLERYKPGMVIERLRWGKLTNVADVTFATLFEAERLDLIPQRDPLSPTRSRKSWIRVVINEVREAANPVPAILPIRGEEIYVTETRLRDRQRGISFVVYRTNAVESPAINAAAMADFERRKQAADKRARAQRIRKLFTVILAVIIFLSPFGLAKVRRKSAEPRRS